MSTPEPTLGTCPHCGARVRVGDAWCSLCYGRVTPQVPAPAVPPPTGTSTTTHAGLGDGPGEGFEEALEEALGAEGDGELVPAAAGPAGRRRKVPRQRRARPPRTAPGGLVGGEVPDDVLEGLASRLAAEVGDGPTARSPMRYGLVAGVGAFVVLVCVLGVMAFAGNLV